MFNKTKSIEIGYHFEMIKVLRAFFARDFPLEITLFFEQKSSAQISRLFSFFYDYLERYIFNFL